MSTIDVESFKTRLLLERERTVKAISYLHEENRATTEDEQRELSGGSDNHLADIATYTYDRELETLLRQTLVSAERTSAELRDTAQKQAVLVVDEAHAAAREIVRAARAERERLAASSSRIRAQLEGALDVLGEGDPAAEAA